jgi:hypothetical protein
LNQSASELSATQKRITNYAAMAQAAKDCQEYEDDDTKDICEEHATIIKELRIMILGMDPLLNCRIRVRRGIRTADGSVVTGLFLCVSCEQGVFPVEVTFAPGGSVYVLASPKRGGEFVWHTTLANYNLYKHSADHGIPAARDYIARTVVELFKRERQKEK